MSALTQRGPARGSLRLSVTGQCLMTPIRAELLRSRSPRFRRLRLDPGPMERSTPLARTPTGNDERCTLLAFLALGSPALERLSEGRVVRSETGPGRLSRRYSACPATTNRPQP
jgi:hypothetical protein